MTKVEWIFLAIVTALIGTMLWFLGQHPANLQ